MQTLQPYEVTSEWPVTKVTTASELLPVEVCDARQYCDYDDDDRDNMFASWIRTATDAVEHDTERALLTQSVSFYFPCFMDELRLPKPPVSAIGTITYVDEDGNSQNLSSSVYQSDLNGTPPKITLDYNQYWPDTRIGELNAVTVPVTCGYGNPEAVPQALKEAILLLVKRMYDDCSGNHQEDWRYMSLIGRYAWRRV